jgi:hypothetical protein
MWVTIAKEVRKVKIVIDITPEEIHAFMKKEPCLMRME